MRTTIPSSLHLFRQCLLLGFLLTPVMAVGQVPDFAQTLILAYQGDAAAQHNLGLMYANGEGVAEDDVLAVQVVGPGAYEAADVRRRDLVKRRVAGAEPIARPGSMTISPAP